MKNLIVEITSRCNLSCAMCLRHSWREATGDMEMETFKGLVPIFSRLDYINLSGYGEPFLHPNLPEMISIARQNLPSSGRIELITNGTLIDKTLAKDVIKAGIDGISVSMDSLELEKFSGIREQGDLNRVIESLKIFLKVRKETKKPFKISVSFVAMKRNIEELPLLVQFAANRGVDAVWVNNVLPYTEDVTKEVLYQAHSKEVLESLTRAKERFMGGNLKTMLPVFDQDNNSSQTVLKIFQKSKKFAASRRLELFLPSLNPETKRECNFIKKESSFVTWDGWVRPCYQLSHDYTCFHYGRPKRVKSINFGKVQDQDLGKIWHSDSYRKFRELVEKFPFSPCGDCGFADGCGYLDPDTEFDFDCNLYEQPCGDCLWSRGLLHCS